jgi:undecaprenyl-diphosphatase
MNRLERFLRRHAWSAPLSALALLSFSRLAIEVHEREVGAFDAAGSAALVGYRGRFDASMLFFTQTGGFLGMTVLCVLATLWLAKLGLRREARFLAACGIGAFFLSSGLKLLFQRARPDATALYLLDVPGSFSFPSGHALGSTCVVGGLAIVGVLLSRSSLARAATIVACLVYVVGVAASRVYFGMHFPSDVVGGMLAGSAWVAAVTGWFYPRLLPGEASGEGS